MGWVGSLRRQSRSIATCVPSMCCRRSGHGSCGTCLRRRSISGLPNLSLSHSTRTVQEIRACLSRSVKRAMARDKVKRNVVELTEVPTGQAGRRSKSLSAEQADDVLTKTAPDRLQWEIETAVLRGTSLEPPA